MRVLTLNLNGVRSALKKGLAEWLQSFNPDLLFLQEIRASSSDWDPTAFLPGFHYVLNPAKKSGYSGVALFSRSPLTEIKLEHPLLSLSEEGRFIQAKIGNLTLINLYCPSGSSSEERQLIKLRYLKELNAFARTLKGPLLIAGDMNIAHTIDDLKNWKQNLSSPGCTPEERAWFTDFLTIFNLVDTFRVSYPNCNDVYTWWSQRGAAYDKNVGWRIDYQLVSHSLAPFIKKTWVERSPKFSDHAAYCCEYDWPSEMT